MKSLDSGHSPIVSVRLSATERAAYLTHLVTMNRRLDAEDWLEISRPLALSATTRLALRAFWLNWCEAQSRITDYFTGSAEFPVGTRSRVWNWVSARLLFALVADEPCGCVSRPFALDGEHVWIWCAWRGVEIQWGSAPVVSGQSFEVALKKHHRLAMHLPPMAGDSERLWDVMWAQNLTRQCYSLGVPL
jgi:hypothetical protein